MQPGAPGTPVAPAAAAGAAGTRHAIIPQHRSSNVVIVLLTLTSVAMGYYLLSRPGFLLGLTEYDDGVYFGTAVRLVHGVIPYRDFIVVQPPGLPLLLAPIAELSRSIGTRHAFGVARLLMPLVLGAQVALVGYVVRHRGTFPTIVACTAMAFFPDARDAAHTVMLEPFLALFCLIGTALVFDRGEFASTRRILLGGIAFGFGGAVKVWAIFPVLVVALLCLKQARRRLVPFAAGVTAGFVVPCLPFFLLDPSAFVRDILLTQLSRHTPGSPTAASRLTDMSGLDGFFNHPSTTLVFTVALALAAVLIAGMTVPGRPRTPLDWFAVCSCAIIVASLLEPPEFFYHYSAFLAPFLALALAASLDRFTTVTARPFRAGRLRRQSIASAALAVLVGIGALALVDRETHVIALASAADYWLAVDPVVPAGSCIASDNSAVLLITNRFEPVPPGCPQLVDSSGTALALDSGSPPQVPGTVTPALVKLWLSAFKAADYLVLTPQVLTRVPFGHGVAIYLHSHFHLIPRAGMLIYVRDGWPDHS